MKKGFKRPPFSKKWKKNLSLAHKGQPGWNKGLKGWTKGTKAGFQKGHKSFLTEKSKLKISLERKGKRQYEMTDEIRKKISLNNAKSNLGKKGKDSSGWKGGSAEYSTIHKWVVFEKGKAKNYICECCRIKSAAQWSNKNHKYRKVLEDYQPLCHRCHVKWDIKFNNFKVGKPKNMKWPQDYIKIEEFSDKYKIPYEELNSLVMFYMSKQDYTDIKPEIIKREREKAVRKTVDKVLEIISLGWNNGQLKELVKDILAK